MKPSIKIKAVFCFGVHTISVKKGKRSLEQTAAAKQPPSTDGLGTSSSPNTPPPIPAEPDKESQTEKASLRTPDSAQPNALELKPLPKPGSSKISRLIMLFCLALALGCSVFVLTRPEPLRGNPTPEAEKLQPIVEQYAAKYGIADHISELMAIMHVESGGRGQDVFQSSESLGLAPNSLSQEESIEQGTKFYASLLERANELGVDQAAVFQAYNFGSGYLDYVAARGGVHTDALAEAFSREYSGGRQVPYNNPIAVARNGGWRYDYGNMFYADLIEQYLSEPQE